MSEIFVDHTPIHHKLFEPNQVLPAMRLAKEGERVVYHEGFLTLDTHFDKYSCEEWQKKLLFMAGEVFKLALEGEVHLLQKKKDKSNYVYFVVKASPEYKKSETHRRWVLSVKNSEHYKVSAVTNRLLMERKSHASGAFV